MVPAASKRTDKSHRISAIMNSKYVTISVTRGVTCQKKRQGKP